MAEHVRRLVSFVGTGNYKTTTYTWRGAPEAAIRTNLVVSALARIFCPDEVICLATEKAQEKWRSEIEGEFKRNDLNSPEFIEIPSGKNEEELWGIFEKCREALDPKHGKGSYILDITNGFRHQPLISGAVSVFRNLTNTPDAIDTSPIRIVYGAFEAREGEEENSISPIFDVTPFLDIVDWAQAIMMFLRTGRGDDLVDLTKQAGQNARLGVPSDISTPALADLAEPLSAFATDLATIRTGSLLLGSDGSDSTAKKLRDAIDRIETAGIVQQAALASILGRLRAMADEMSLPPGVSTLAGADAHPVTVNLAKRYLEMDRYMEAATTVTEGLASLLGEPKAGQPGPCLGRKARKRAENLAQEKRDTMGLEDADIRNDLNHGGFRRNPAAGQEIAETVTRYVEAFGSASFETDQPSAEPRRPTRTSAVFLNISHHRLEDWDPAQVEAAQAMAPNLREISFPNVPPDADEDDIATLVEDLDAQVPPETTHAMVQGEFSLTFALVHRLQKRGITCLAATTERDVKLEADGTRRYRFTFRRFRTYCSNA